LRVLRRISRTALSARSLLLNDFWLIFVPCGHYDEPEILRYAITSICPRGADVRHQEHNLLDDLRSLGKFDVVFCRNVLIYFDSATKARVLEGIARIMPDDGLLFLGGAETVIGVTNRFKPVPGQRGIYCINREAAATSQPLSAASGAR
jgi:hypothetical protein